MPTREQLDKLLAAEPDDVFLNFGLAMELSKEASKAPALKQFARIIELDADYTAAYYQQGRLLLGLGDREQARQVLTAGVEATKRTGDAHAQSEMQELLDQAC
ncbi:MAG: hypothetical protein IID40_08800 [Planctomycetes bacterium]|nr:hypothetical protein [Planctomycetota bacterium]